MKTMIVAAFAAVGLVAVMASPEPEADPGYQGRRGIGSHGNFRGSHGSRYGGYSGHSHGGYSNYGYRRGKRSADPEAVAEADAEPSYGYNPYNSYTSRRSYPVTSYSSSGSYGYGGRWKRSADPEAAAEPSFGYNSYNSYNSRRSYPVTSYSNTGSYGYGGRWKRSADPEAAAEADAEPGHGRLYSNYGYQGGNRGFQNRGQSFRNYGYGYGR